MNTNTTTVSSGKIGFMGFDSALSILTDSITQNIPNMRVERFNDLDTKSKKNKIGTEDFEVKDLSVDVDTIADGFGFSQDTMKFEGLDDNEAFQKLLDVLDMTFAAALVIPMDKIDSVKSGIKIAASALRKYVPNFRTIGSLLSMAPGIAKYSKALITFGEAMDQAINIIDRGEKDCIRNAIKEVRNGIDAMRSVDIIDINKQVSDAKIKDEDIIESTFVVTDATDNDKANNSDKATTKSKKKESDNKKETKSKRQAAASDNEVVDAAAMNQDMMPGFIPEQYGDIPAWMDTNLDSTPRSSVPEFISQNDMNVPRVNVQERIFAPVQQPGYYVDQRLASYGFVNDIHNIANSVGIYVAAELITNSDNRPMAISFKAYNAQAFLPDKSFVVDLGAVIDGRFGIWPCTPPCILEECDVCYRLMESDKQDSPVNKTFLLDLFKFGFNNLGDDIKKKNTLYGIRMCEANRVFNLISIPAQLSGKIKSIVRGAFIRSAPEFIRLGYNANGKFNVVGVNPNTLEITISNDGASKFFMTPAIPHAPMVITFKPALDENGHHIPAGNKGGGDIKFDVFINN